MYIYIMYILLLLFSVSGGARTYVHALLLAFLHISHIYAQYIYVLLSIRPGNELIRERKKEPW